MTTNSTSHHIAIAGAGPIGMTLALALGRDGHQVTIYEQGQHLSDESRASTFHPSTLEYFSTLGVVDEMLQSGLIVRNYQYRDRRAGKIATFDYSSIADDTQFPFRLQLEQSQLTRILLPILQDLPNVAIKFGTEIEHIRHRADHQVEVSFNSAGRHQTAVFDYLVGTDGASSAVRRSLGFSFDGITYPERYLVASTPFELTSVLPDLSWVNYVSDPDEWLLMLRTPAYWRVMFPLSKAESDEQAQAPRRVQERLHGVYDLDGDYPLLHTTVYKVHQRVASSFASGHVALAGDAAHVNNPIGGLGMNSGLFDAFALRACFASIANGCDAECSLYEYSVEQRRISIDYVGEQTDRNWNQLRASNETLRRERNRSLQMIADDKDQERDFLLRISMFKTELA